MTQSKSHELAIEQNKLGLEFYQTWKLDKAITAFKAAVAADPNNPEYHLNLARACARSSDYEQAMQAVGHYLHVETDEEIANRYQHLFTTAMDEVETVLTDGMRRLDMPIQQIGKAIQMWLEYRIAIGRRPFRVPKPELWAAALTYAIAKINLLDLKRSQIADTFDVNERSLKEKFDDLRETLDLMAADYRYFSAENNPLDKLLEVAQLLEELETKFLVD